MSNDMSGLRLLFVIALISWVGDTSVAQNTATTPVNPETHRAEIRAALLKATPIGSRATDVLAFIRKSLLREGAAVPKLEDHPAQLGAAAESPKRGVKSIHVLLGQYIDNPAVIILSGPLVLEKEVTAEWAFDKDDRLIEIFVDKQTATY